MWRGPGSDRSERGCLRATGERSSVRMAVSTPASLPERVSFARIPDIREMPSLIQVQVDSYAWFKREGLKELFAELAFSHESSGLSLLTKGLKTSEGNKSESITMESRIDLV